MARGYDEVSTEVGLHQRNARQIAGLSALGAIAFLVSIALLAIGLTGFTDVSALSFSSIARVSAFTVWQAFLSVVLSIGLAIPVALAFEALPRFHGRRFILVLFTLPLCLPVIVAVMAVLTLLGRNGLLSQLVLSFGMDWRPDIYGLPGILVAHVFFNMPLAVRIILQRFEDISGEQWKLAESLGFGAVLRFRFLLWPNLRAALPSLAALIFLLCMGSYAIILVLGGGPQATTLQVAIFQALSFDFDIARAALLTVVQIGLTVVVLSVLPDPRDLIVPKSVGGFRRYHQTRFLGISAAVLTLVFAVSVIVLPMLAIVYAGLAANHSILFRDALLWRATLTSTIIGLATSLISLSLAFALSAGIYGYKNSAAPRWAKVLGAVPLLLLGMPALVLGVGWFLFALQTGVSLRIAPVLIVFTNALMALPFAMQIIAPALQENYDRHDRLCAALGLSGWARFKLIDVPHMHSALIGAGLFGFALSLGDLGVVTLFGTDQIVTLPSLIFQKMGSYRSQDAAGIALYLAVFTGTISYFALKGQLHDR